MTDADCRGATRCVQNKCVKVGSIFQVPGPQIELQLVGPDGAATNCRRTRRAATEVLDDLFDLLEASGLSVLMRQSTPTTPEGEEAIEQLDVALDSGSRAIITVSGFCEPFGREEIHIKTTDLVFLRAPSHLSLKLFVRQQGTPKFNKDLRRFANKLWTIEGAPPGVFGSRIAFSCKIRPGIRDIYSVDPLGEDLRRETRFQNITILPSWSPDGQVASTSYITGDASIHLGNRLFVAKEGLNTGIDFHKRSGRFVFANADDDSQNLYLGNTRSGRVLQSLTQTKHIDTAPTFSPDGRRVAFVSDRSGSPQIYILTLRDRRVERLSQYGSYNTAPDWSPDGTNLVWNRQIGGDRNVIVMRNLDESASSERVLISGSKSYEHPAFSPDGRSIVVAEIDGAKARPVLVDIRTKEIEAFISEELPGACSQATWSRVID